MNKELAKESAIAALTWLAQNPNDLSAFLTASGATFDDLRVRSKEPEFLGFVLDFFMASDELIISLSDELKIPPTELSLARALLPGGDLPNWT